MFSIAKVDVVLMGFKIFFSVLFFTILFTVRVQAQSKELVSFSSLAEKIYTRTDSKIYTNDQVIWFNALVTNAVDHAPTSISGVLYVELIDPFGKIVENKLIRLEQGTGSGFFQLNENYFEGQYRLRAYTEWNKNFNPGFFSDENIQIFRSTAKTQASPFKSILLVKENDHIRSIKAIVDPLAIDSAHEKAINVFVNIDSKKDSFQVRKNNDGLYLIEYPVNDSNAVLTMRLQTKNLYTASRSVIIDKEAVDVQFFPESGRWVHGLPAVLGFKISDVRGNGKETSGEIINSKGIVTAKLRSNKFGMGVVSVGIADSTEVYRARIYDSATAISRSTLYNLPKIDRSGHILSVQKFSDQIKLHARSSVINADTMIVRIASRGVVHFNIKGVAKNGTMEYQLQENALPEGIICFTLMNAEFKPLAERLYFNKRSGTGLNVSIAPDKKSYQLREQIKLDVQTNDVAGNPVPASTSVIVYNETESGDARDLHQNILSWFLLSSELRGDIEHPDYYFEENPDRSADLDALMLTQGWRKYLFNQAEGEIRFTPEENLVVSGTVNGSMFQNKAKRETGLTLITFGKNSSVYAEKSDSLGRFRFEIQDEFTDRMNILIQSSNKSGSQKDYTIKIDQKESPPVAEHQFNFLQEPDSIVRIYVQANMSRKQAEDSFRKATEGVVLEEVIVRSYRMTPERKQVTDRFGKAKTVIEGQVIRDKEEKWSFGLYSVLMFSFPEQVRIDRRSDGNLYARLFNNEMTLVVIDGIPVMPYDYPLIPNIPPSEVSSFEIIEYAKDFSSLYCEIMRGSCANPPPIGNVIAIYTYGKKGLFGANRPVGISKMAIPVFSVQREFFKPKYENLQPDDWKKPDLRTLIHWAPEIKTDSAGRAQVSFYNGDYAGKVKVIVEAISQNGELGYQEIELDSIKN